MILYARMGDQMIPFQIDQEDADHYAGRRFSIGSHGYVQTGYGKLLHRELLGLVTRDGNIADHINGNRLDNRRANLRVVTPSMSSANVKHNPVSGYRGVYPNKKRWAAAAKQDGRKLHLGTYDTPEQAARVAHEWRLANLPGYVVR